MPGGRKRTPTWNFSQVSGRAKCNDCNYSCSMDAKRMQKHRLEFHSEESSILDAISDESQDDQPRVTPKHVKMDAFIIATSKADKEKFDIQWVKQLIKCNLTKLLLLMAQKFEKIWQSSFAVVLKESGLRKQRTAIKKLSRGHGLLPNYYTPRTWVWNWALMKLRRPLIGKFPLSHGAVFEFIGENRYAIKQKFEGMEVVDPLKFMRSQIALGKLSFELSDVLMVSHVLVPSRAGIERVFSTMGHIHTDKRNRVSAEKTTQLTFINKLLNQIFE